MAAFVNCLNDFMPNFAVCGAFSYGISLTASRSVTLADAIAKFSTIEEYIVEVLAVVLFDRDEMLLKNLKNAKHSVFSPNDIS